MTTAKRLEFDSEKAGKNEGKTPADAPRENVVDLMSALQASIDKSKEKPAAKEPAAKTKKKAAAGKKTKTARKKRKDSPAEQSAGFLLFPNPFRGIQQRRKIHIRAMIR